MKYYFFTKHISLLFFICVLSNFNIHSKKNPPQKDQTNFFLLVNRFGVFSPEFIEQMIYFNPKLCATGITTAAGYYLYKEEIEKIKNYLYEHKNIVFGSMIASLALLYFNRHLIADNLYLDAPEEDTSNNNYQEFSKAHFSVYLPGQITTTFKDVAGLDTAKSELQDILSFLENPKAFEDIGAKIPKGILFYGAPGNGKTLLARALAGQTQCPFIYVNASSFIEAVVGVGAARIRNLFKIAKKLAPCVIFIDELDSIGSKRNNLNASSGAQENVQALNELLSQLDGFEEHHNPIIIIGATNRISSLDKALLRPGRFDKKIEITKPYILDRIELITLMLQRVKHSDDINIEKIAQATNDFSAADLNFLINEAAILAVRNGKTEITTKDIEQAYDIFLMGHPTLGILRTSDEIYRTSIHEAGHALARVLQNNAHPLYKVSITPRGNALGITYGLRLNELLNATKESLRAEIVVALAGAAAEEYIFSYRDSGCDSDLQKARNIATAMIMQYGMSSLFQDITFVDYINNEVHLPDSLSIQLQNEISKIITECKIEATHIIQTHATELQQISEMLLKEETISGNIIYQLCNVQEPAIHYSLI